MGRTGKEGEVRGQGLGRGKAWMQDFLPGVLCRRTGGAGEEGFRVIRAVRKPENTDRKASVSTALHQQ